MVLQKDVVETCYKLLKYEGIFTGPSTRAHVYAAIEVAKELGKEKNVVTIATDTSYKYLTTIYSREWIRKRIEIDM